VATVTKADSAAAANECLVVLKCLLTTRCDDDDVPLCKTTVCFVALMASAAGVRLESAMSEKEVVGAAMKFIFRRDAGNTGAFNKAKRVINHGLLSEHIMNEATVKRLPTCKPTKSKEQGH
jgi:hypothetical protein